MTSFTDFVAFFISSNSNLPALQGFGMFAALCILADFLLQVSLFVAFLVLNERRASANRLDLVPCVSATARCTSPVDRPSINPSGEADESEVARTLVGRMFYNYYAPVLLKPAVKIGVLVLCGGLFAFSLFGASQLRSGLSNTDVLPTDSYLLQFFQRETKYFDGFNSKVDVVFTGFFDYSDEDNQDLILQVSDTVNTSDLVRPEFSHSWLKAFLAWVKVQQMRLAGVNASSVPTVDEIYVQALLAWLRDSSGGVPIDALNQTVPNSFSLSERGRPRNAQEFYELLFVFLLTDGRRHADDLVLQYGAIKVSRIRNQHISLLTDFKRAQAILDMRAMTDVAASESNGNVNAFPFCGRYIFWEQFIGLVPRNIANFAIVGVSIFVLCYLFLGDAILALIVLACVVLVDVDMLGVGFLWSIDLNNVMMTLLLVALGVAVDATAHVTHAVMTARLAAIGRQATPGNQDSNLEEMALIVDSADDSEQDQSDQSDSAESNSDAPGIVLNVDSRGTGSVLSSPSDEAIRTALGGVGSSVFAGSLTSFLGILGLAFSNHTILTVFFKFFFSVFLLAMFHGLMVLPVLLSYWGRRREKADLRRRS
jgi:Patched family